ncbi:hypothetical protein [Holospora undulata]|nr:hypothetical protein [Holospora undulata]
MKAALIWLCASTEGWRRKSEKLIGKKGKKWYQRTNSMPVWLITNRQRQ